MTFNFVVLPVNMDLNNKNIFRYLLVDGLDQLCMYILLLISNYIFILCKQTVQPVVRIILPTFNILCYSKELSTKNE
jgi:hypothetical protein